MFHFYTHRKKNRKLEVFYVSGGIDVVSGVT